MRDPDPASDGEQPADSVPDSTAYLVVRAASGEAAARNRLAARYIGPLRRFAHGRLPARARSLLDTDDLVQVTMIRAFDSMKSFEWRGQGSFLAYLRQILLNRMRDEIRRADRGPDQLELPENLSSGGLSPLEAAIGRDTLEIYEKALSQLTPSQQEAVIMRIELGCTFPEIAQAMGRPTANAARMVVARAVARMAELMHSVREG